LETADPKTCPKCRGSMERGRTKTFRFFGDSAIGAEPAQLKFVVSGTPTSWNPLHALAQGMSHEPEDRTYGIVGFRCSACGYLELFAIDDPNELAK
jgi:hypothetical protein